MSFTWPLALLSLLVVPALLGVYLVDAAPAAQAGRALLERRAAALGAARGASGGSGTSRSPCCSPASSRSRSPPAGRTSCAASRTHARRSSSRSTSRGRCARPTSSPTGSPSRRRRPATFVENQPKGMRMGLVVFSGFAELTVPPTTDRKALVAAIDGLTTGHGTAIGSAMLKGLDAIAEVNPAVRPVGDTPESEPAPAGTKPGANGFVPDIVVLLTDGANNRGIEPLDAVPYAVERRVRVYPIGFGTTNPSPSGVHARAARRRRLRPGGFGGGGRRVRRWRRLRRLPRRGRADPEGGRRADRRHVPRRQGRRSAAQGVLESAEGGREAEAADRDHLDASRRSAPLLAAAAVAASMRWSPYP